MSDHSFFVGLGFCHQATSCTSFDSPDATSETPSDMIMQQYYQYQHQHQNFYEQQSELGTVISPQTHALQAGSAPKFISATTHHQLVYPGPPEAHNSQQHRQPQEQYALHHQRLQQPNPQPQPQQPPSQQPEYHQLPQSVSLYLSSQKLPQDDPASDHQTVKISQHTSSPVPAFEPPPGYPPEIVGAGALTSASSSIAMAQQPQSQPHTIPSRHVSVQRSGTFAAEGLHAGTSSSSGQPGTSLVNSGAPQPTNCISAGCSFSFKPSAMVAARERTRKHESDRLAKAVLRNLEYIAKKDEEELQRHLREIQQTHADSERLQQQHEVSYDRKKQALLQKNLSKAGIGTKTRKEAVKAFGVKKHRPQAGSVYVSGMGEDVNEGTIRSLFEAFGKVQRVQLYKDSKTGKLKGDALVVYVGDKIDINSVCSQLNGAVLPCGSTLTVQPACFDWKKNEAGKQKLQEQLQRSTGCTKNGDGGKRSLPIYGGEPRECTDPGNRQKRTKESSVGYYGPTASLNGAGDTTRCTATGSVNAPKTKEEAGQDASADLDDFFASLE